MSSMDQPTVIQLDRSRRLMRAVAARRRLRDVGADRRGQRRRGGRAWLNGSELGETREALAHLGESYD